VKNFCRLTWYAVNSEGIVTEAEVLDGQIEDLLPIIHSLNSTDYRWRLTSMVGEPTHER
jgi:hypothetical protein